MANSAKDKGDAAEREVAQQLAALTGWPVQRKLGAGRAEDTGDLYGIPDTTVQVKNYVEIARAINDGLHDLAKQQANSGDPFGAVLVRRRGGHWIAVLTLDGFATLLREATGP